MLELRAFALGVQGRRGVQTGLRSRRLPWASSAKAGAARIRVAMLAAASKHARGRGCVGRSLLFPLNLDHQGASTSDDFHACWIRSRTASARRLASSGRLIAAHVGDAHDRGPFLEFVR